MELQTTLKKSFFFGLKLELHYSGTEMELIELRSLFSFAPTPARCYCRENISCLTIGLFILRCITKVRGTNIIVCAYKASAS